MSDVLLFIWVIFVNFLVKKKKSNLERKKLLDKTLS